MPLTELKIQNAKPAVKQYRIADGGGLFLQVMPNGGKYWRFRYLYLGREKMLALGTYPELSLADAREKRLEARKLVAAGRDPGEKKKDDKRHAAFQATNTFAALAKEWHETNKPSWSADHAARVWRRLETHILPDLGYRPVADIKPMEVLNALRKVEARGNTEMSRRLKQSVEAVFRMAVVTSRAEINPAANLKGTLKPHKATHYPTISDEMVPAFLEKLREVNAAPQIKIAMRLLMLTFVRTGELRKCSWEHVDLETATWTVPAEITKMKEMAHIVPLSRQAVAAFEELRELTGGKGLLFPPLLRSRHPYMSENTINNVIKKMGYKGQMVGHGFRALASTTLNEMGYPADVIERQLAHKETNQVRAAYNHAQYLPQRAAMMQEWADHIDRLVRGEPVASNITPFRRAS